MNPCNDNLMLTEDEAIYYIDLMQFHAEINPKRSTRSKPRKLERRPRIA